MMLRVVSLGCALLAASAAFALQPDEILPDPAREARARAITGELRCVVCQSQSIDESDAPLARDLRLLVRERVQAGDSDATIREFLVRRYGEFVLLKPVLGLHTALLWLGPLLVFATAALSIALLRRRRPAGPPPLTPDEEARLRTLGAPSGGGADPG